MTPNLQALIKTRIRIILLLPLYHSSGTNDCVVLREILHDDMMERLKMTFFLRRNGCSRFPPVWKHWGPWLWRFAHCIISSTLFLWPIQSVRHISGIIIYIIIHTQIKLSLNDIYLLYETHRRTRVEEWSSTAHFGVAIFVDGCYYLV